MRKTPETVEQRLDAWSRQPGAMVTDAERDFIAAMRRHAERGVGYGWMQQVIEWEWQSKGPGAFGPEYFNRERTRLERERGELREAAQDIVDHFKGGPQHIVDSCIFRHNSPEIARLRALLARVRP